MTVEAQVAINGSRAATWAAVADIEHAANVIRGIEKIEVLERPASGLVGLRWLETRILFGKPATVQKWITEASEGEFYTSRADEQGFIYLATIRISESEGGVTLKSSHDSLPQGFVPRLMSIPMGLFFRGVMKKALLQDLSDIKSSVERV